MAAIRQKSQTAVGVEKGLAAALLADVKTGATVMKACGVPIKVALRVLLHPVRRRTNDWRLE